MTIWILYFNFTATCVLIPCGWCDSLMSSLFRDQPIITFWPSAISWPAPPLNKEYQNHLFIPLAATRATPTPGVQMWDFYQTDKIDHYWGFCEETSQTSDDRLGWTLSDTFVTLKTSRSGSGVKISRGRGRSIISSPTGCCSDNLNLCCIYLMSILL